MADTAKKSTNAKKPSRSTSRAKSTSGKSSAKSSIAKEALSQDVAVKKTDEKATHKTGKKKEITLSKSKLTSTIKWFAIGVVLMATSALILFVIVVNTIGAVVNGEFISTREVIKRAQDRYGEQILDELIDYSLIRQKAKQEGVSVDEGEVDARIEEIALEQFGSMEAFNSFVEQQAVSMEEIRESISLSLLIEKLLEDTIEISEEEARNYFRDNSDQFSQEGQVTTFADVKDQVYDAMKREKIGIETSTYIEGLRDDARISKTADLKDSLLALFQ